MLKKQSLIFLGLAVLLITLTSFIAFRNGADQSHKVPRSNTAPSNTNADIPKPQAAEFNKSQYSTVDPASPWVIVNKQHPLNPLSYAPADLTAVGNGQQMRAEAATALQRMFADAQAAGYTLTADSGYRSYSYQVSVYGGYVKQWGQTYTDTVSARPGYSEHQSGWAMDIGTGSCHVDSCFGDTAGGKWTQANAYKYGFILRYPAGLTNVTGYSPEAWHFRYIGPALSNYLHTENIHTLEQLFGVSGGTNYK